MLLTINEELALYRRRIQRLIEKEPDYNQKTPLYTEYLELRSRIEKILNEQQQQQKVIY